MSNTAMWVVVLAAALSAAAEQQHQHPLDRPAPATLVRGLGRLHHEIATTSEEAQKFFNQGLTFVYAFNHDEAVRSFRRAAELDPLSPMPLWGVALALGPNINLDVDPQRELAAYEAAQRANVLAARAPARERAYVDAILKRYSNDPGADLKALAVRYKDAMRDLARIYPDDLDAATLYAESLMDLHPWQLWSKDGTPTEGTEEIVAVLEGVLTRDPSHIGANHYYIHAVEASRAPDRALDSARRLETLVPAAGHLVHMPAHIYMRTGDYGAAVTSNAKAAAVDRVYIRTEKVTGVYPLMYYNHNLDFLASAAMMGGQLREAQRAASDLVATVMPALEEMPMIEPFGAKNLYVALRFGRWSDALLLPMPDEKWTILTLVSRLGRGIAQAALGRVAEAESEHALYVGARDLLAPDTDWGYNKARAMTVVTDAVFDARLAWAKGEKASSIAAWRRAVAAEDALSYNEPPDWYYPSRESLGAALLLNGQPAEAERVFRDDLERNPKNGRSLFGLAEALRAQKKDNAAAAADRAFKAAWKRADVKLDLRAF